MFLNKLRVSGYELRVSMIPEIFKPELKTRGFRNP
jgi:hypothetical protein